MNVLGWVKGWFSRGGKSTALYRRGMARARRHDHQGAIDDYTEMLGIIGTAPHVKAMARYNRALAYAADGRDSLAIQDLEHILAQNEARQDVKTEARRRLLRMQRRSSHSDA